MHGSACAPEERRWIQSRGGAGVLSVITLGTAVPTASTVTRFAAGTAVLAVLRGLHVLHHVLLRSTERGSLMTP